MRDERMRDAGETTAHYVKMKWRSEERVVN